MLAKRQITNLPPELRRQIFSEYFKVQGGYTYDVESDKLRNAADNTPIDLSLMYTCRSIANDCKELPLAANTIHFSTVYREDWCRLAGCFNFAATYYRVLQEDFVMHLAYLITSEMYQQIKGDFPGFRSKFEEAKKVHSHIWHGIDDASSAEWLHHANAGDPEQQSKCGFVTSFLCENLLDPMERSLADYRGYAHVDRRVWFHQRGERLFHPFEDVQDRWDNIFNHWDDTASGEVCRSLHQLLALIADQNPEEFADRVYLYMPHWRGKYPAEDFLHMKLGRELWAMPSRSQLSDFLERLGIDEFVWNLPGIWTYGTKFHWNLRDSFGRSHNAEHYRNPPVDFELRSHEKIRFSAAAVAIRFIGQLPYHQRMQLRMVNIYEDLPAVNLQSFHGDGLVPLLKDNTKLKIERRVSVVDSIMKIYMDIENVQSLEMCLLQSEGFNTVDQRFVPNLSCWLLDALSVADAVPSKSFSLLLDSGPYADACTEAFEQLVHGSIARAKAWEHHVRANLIQGIPEKGIRNITLMFSYASEVRLEEAVMMLVNDSSTVLRCNFNPGLPRDPQWIVDKVRDKCTELRYNFAYLGWASSTLLGPVKLPNHLNDIDSVARVCAIQSGDQYQKSQGRDVPHVRTVNDMIELKRARYTAVEPY